MSRAAGHCLADSVEVDPVVPQTATKTCNHEWATCSGAQTDVPDEAAEQVHCSSEPVSVCVCVRVFLAVLSWLWQRTRCG